MTGRPIDTTAMRKDAVNTLSNGAESQAEFDMAEHVLALCDALDAARAENNKLRAAIDVWVPREIRDNLREALGEEKQR